MQQLGHIVAGQAHDHPFSRHLHQHRIEHRQLLVFAQCCRFRRGAADHNAIDTFFQQMIDQPAQADEIDRTVAKRRNEGNPNTLKR